MCRNPDWKSSLLGRDQPIQLLVRYAWYTATTSSPAKVSGRMPQKRPRSESVSQNKKKGRSRGVAKVLQTSKTTSTKLRHCPPVSALTRGGSSRKMVQFSFIVFVGHGRRGHDPRCKTPALLRSAEYSERTSGHDETRAQRRAHDLVAIKLSTSSPVLATIRVPSCGASAETATVSLRTVLLGARRDVCRRSSSQSLVVEFVEGEEPLIPMASSWTAWKAASPREGRGRSVSPQGGLSEQLHVASNTISSKSDSENCAIPPADRA